MITSRGSLTMLGVLAVVATGVSTGFATLNYGDIMGAYRGVGAKSNGQYAKTVEGEWQCVEYFKRFENIEFGVAAYISVGFAANIYGRADEFDLTAYPNGGRVPPMPTDALCFSGGLASHLDSPGQGGKMYLEISSNQ